MKYKFVILFISLIYSLSCTKEESDFRLSMINMPIITGYNLRDLEGVYIGAIGNPNINTCCIIDGNKSNDMDSLSPNTINTTCLIAYPNPCKETLMLRIQSPSEQLDKKIWITKATLNYQIVSSTNDLNMTFMSVGGSSLLQYETTNDAIMMNISSFDDGYYRIYVKIADHVLYDNLVIQKINNN